MSVHNYWYVRSTRLRGLGFPSIRRMRNTISRDSTHAHFGHACFGSTSRRELAPLADALDRVCPTGRGRQEIQNKISRDNTYDHFGHACFSSTSRGSILLVTQILAKMTGSLRHSEMLWTWSAPLAEADSRCGIRYHEIIGMPILGVRVLALHPAGTLY